MEIDLVVFDLDGTLVDSKVDLANAVNATRAGVRLPPLDDEIVYSYVGNGAPLLIRKALGNGFGGDQIQHSLDFFLSYYRIHMLDHTRPYPGVPEALDRMSAAGKK